MNSFFHFKNIRKKGIIKGYFYSFIVIALLYLLFTPYLTFLIFPNNSELILQLNQHSNEKLDFFVTLLKSFLIMFGMVGLFRVWLVLKYQCREYQILGEYLDSLDQEKIKGNYANFIQDLHNVLINMRSEQNNEKYSNIIENIKCFLTGSLNKQIIDCYQNYVLSSALLITFSAIFLIKAINHLVHFSNL